VLSLSTQNVSFHTLSIVGVGGGGWRGGGSNEFQGTPAIGRLERARVSLLADHVRPYFRTGVQVSLLYPSYHVMKVSDYVLLNHYI
jgi:hypothetical protein